MKRINYIKRIKYMFFLIISLILGILICIILLLFSHGYKDTENQIIIDKFARQQMLSQIMSKDAGRIYSLRQAIATETNYQSSEVIEKKLKEVTSSLSKSKEEFEHNLNSMNQGYLEYNDTIIDIQSELKEAEEELAKSNEIWKQFERSIEILLTSDDMNAQSAEAIIYIQDNNNSLLSLSENISKKVLDNTILEEKSNKRIIYGFILLLSISILFAFRSLHSYILVPYRQLYEGFEEIGLVYSNKENLGKKNFTPLLSEVGDMFKKINYLFKLLENMNNNYSFVEMLNFINRTFSEFIPYNYIGIGLIDEEKKVITASYGVSDENIIGLPDKLIGKSFVLNETSLAGVIKSGEARIINDLEDYTKGRPLKYYNKDILEAGVRSSITLPLKLGNEPIGVIFFSSNQKNVYKEEHIILLKMLVNSIAVSFEQNIFIDNLLYSNTLALAKLAEARDEDTGEHLERMKIYSAKLAEFLYNDEVYKDEITLEYISQIERFSPLHDIGKVGVADGILLKPGKLTTEEFEEMKKHTTYGAAVLRTAEETINKHKKCLFRIGIEIAEGHQEKWDGSGYPYGKKGEDIPLSARIVAVADVLDALTSVRPYKKAFSFERSFQMIVEERGTHFDPIIIDTFIKHKGEILKIYKRFYKEEKIEE